MGTSVLARGQQRGIFRVSNLPCRTLQRQRHVTNLSELMEIMPRMHTDVSCMFWVTHVQLPRHNKDTPLVGGIAHGGGCVDVGSTGV